MERREEGGREGGMKAWEVAVRGEKGWLGLGCTWHFPSEERGVERRGERGEERSGWDRGEERLREERIEIHGGEGRRRGGEGKRRGGEGRRKRSEGMRKGVPV